MPRFSFGNIRIPISCAGQRRASSIETKQGRFPITPLLTLLTIGLLVSSAWPLAFADEAGQSAETQNVITIPPDPTNGATPAIVISVPKNSNKQPQAPPAQAHQLGQSPLERKSTQNAATPSLPPTPSAAPPICPTSPPGNRLYSDITAVFLDVETPPEYAEALECLGHEQECAANSGAITGIGSSGISATDKAKYIEDTTNRLKELNSKYPPSLRPDNLIALLQPAVKNALSKIMVRTKDCQVPEPIILGRETKHKPDGTNDALTITLGVRFVNTTPSGIVVLTATYFRMDSTHSSYLNAQPEATAFPLDMDAKGMQQIVERFVHASARMPFPQGAPGQE